jgi:TetR/AcrR family transcriptional repressor of nem operon
MLARRPEISGRGRFWTVQSRTMARPREFDADDALERATRLFWTKGFEQTSLDELCAATGLGRSSLYAAFGDKRALYLRTLARYEERSAARIAAALAGKPIREGLAAFLGALIDDIVAGPGRRGCFIGNCAAELARLDRSAAAQVRASLERIEAAFRHALVGAKERGELSVQADPAALARFLTAGIQGLRLVGKANPERVALEDIASAMLRCLDFKER